MNSSEVTRILWYINGWGSVETCTQTNRWMWIDCATKLMHWCHKISAQRMLIYMETQHLVCLDLSLLSAQQGYRIKMLTLDWAIQRYNTPQSIQLRIWLTFVWTFLTLHVLKKAACTVQSHLFLHSFALHKLPPDSLISFGILQSTIWISPVPVLSRFPSGITKSHGTLFCWLMHFFVHDAPSSYPLSKCGHLCD